MFIKKFHMYGGLPGDAPQEKEDAPPEPTEPTPGDLLTMEPEMGHDFLFLGENPIRHFLKSIGRPR
jgi:hypothetical protein